MQFKDLVSKVTLTHKDPENPYKDENWYAAEINKEDPKIEPTKAKGATVRAKRKSGVSHKPYAIKQRQRQIVKLVTEQPMREYEIEASLGYSMGGAWHTLQKLVSQGKIMREDDYYTAPVRTAKPAAVQLAPRPVETQAAPPQPTEPSMFDLLEDLYKVYCHDLDNFLDYAKKSRED